MTVADDVHDRRADTAVVAERFVSFQGEGPLAGQRCAFVRFSRCNLCCTWCDTKQTWDWKQYDPTEVSRRVPTAELVEWVKASGVDLVVITGGEPMLQQPAMLTLATGVGSGVRVQVETNGTLSPIGELADRVDLWVVSPKLANSGIPRRRRIVGPALAALHGSGNAVFKFVVTDPVTDFEEIGELEAEFGIGPIWVMPEGETREQVLTGLASWHELALVRGWNVTTRLHILTGAR